MSERLAALAERLAGDPDFIAGHVTTADLAAALGCDEATAVKVRLCRSPRHAGDVVLIAGRFGVDAGKLGELLASE